MAAADVIRVQARYDTLAVEAEHRRREETSKHEISQARINETARNMQKGLTFVVTSSSRLSVCANTHTVVSCFETFYVHINIYNIIY